MDFHEMGSSSSSQGETLPQETRQAHTKNSNDMRPQKDLSIPRIQHLEQVSNAIQPEPHVESEIQQNTGIAMPSESSGANVVQKAENVIKTATTEAINLMRYQVEKKIEFVIGDCKVQELCQEDGAAKMRCLKIQMENEALSQEKDSLLKSVSGQALRIKNTGDICRILKEHLEKLRLTAERMEKVKNELSITFSGLSDDLNSRSKNRKTELLEYQNNMENLKSTVMEERQLRISEMNDANNNYHRLAEILNGKMLILKQEEEKYSALKLKDEELQHSITKEELKLKAVLKHSHESLQSLDCANQTLETHINSYKSTQKELEISSYGLTVERECLKRQIIALEEWFKTVSSEEKVLTAELDSAKQKLSYCETECAVKCKQEHTIEAEIVDLLRQKYEFEDKIKDMSRKLEDSRTKHEFSMQDLTNLRMMLENIRSENQVVSDSYRSELLDLESELSIVKEEVHSKHIKLKEQENATSVLQQELEKENTLQKSLQLELQNLKASATDEEKRKETLRSIIEDEKIQSEELNRLLLVNQSEVEKLKEEVERKLEEHTDYKKEVLVESNKKREEIKAVKEKREEMDCERDRKRQEMMEGLHVCREASIKQADEKEAELNEQSKKNCILKEKLNSIVASKESMEKDLNIQKNMLERKMTQLKMDLENEKTQCTIWSKSKICKRNSPLIKADLKPPLPSSVSSQAYMEAKYHDRVTSDSDRSSVDFCDLVNKLYSGKKTDKRQSQDSVKKRRLEIHSQPEKMQTGGMKLDHLQPVCYTAPSEQQVKSGSFKSGKHKKTLPVDILSSL